MSSRSARLLAACAMCCIALGFASPSIAAPSAAEKETARELMATGRTKRDGGDLKGALDAFKAADSIMHVPTTGLEVAKTQIALGQLVEGLDTLLMISRIPVAPNEPEPFTTARQEAAALVDTVKPRIPTLRIVAEGLPPGVELTVTVDGVAFPPVALQVPLRLDPGTRVVVVRAGTVSKKSSVDLAEGESRTLTVDLSDAKVEPPPAPSTAAPPASTPPVTDEPRSGTSPLTYIGFGVGGAALVAGTVTGLISWGKTSSLKDQCHSNQCSASLHDDLSSARTLATISTISFVVTGVGVGVGLYGLFSGAPAPRKNEASVRVYVGIGSAGLAGSF